jgi:HK97 gp10 family phage protein
MTSVLDMKTTGLPEVLAQLKRMQDAVKPKYLRKGLYAGAAIIRDEAKKRAPVRTGLLRKNIVARTDRDPQNPGSYAGYVSIRNAPTIVVATANGERLVAEKTARKQGKKGKRINPRRYAAIVEYGAGPHKIGKLDHPGSAPTPFLRPALEAKRELAIRVAAQTIKDAMKRDFDRSLGFK